MEFDMDDFDVESVDGGWEKDEFEEFKLVLSEIEYGNPGLCRYFETNQGGSNVR